MAFALRATEKVNCVTEDEELRKRGYVVGVTLGEGSYAKVKSALSEKLGRKVALKIINRRKAPKDFQQRFLPRELEVLKLINHPNVIQMYEIMHFNGKVYIAMEIAGHGDLLEYIKLRGAIQEEKARHMFQQLVHAVDYLHQNNIVHRDLKCENILLDCQNNVKVSDFGFARILLPTDLSKTFCGSAAYAAPEILQGIPYTGPSYDIWSMGVILYIMVCGSMPYDDSNIKKMIKYQTERKVGFSRHKKVSDECKNLIHLILEAQVKNRATIRVINAHRWMNPQVSPTSMDGVALPASSSHHHSHHRHGQQAVEQQDKGSKESPRERRRHHHHHQHTGETSGHEAHTSKDHRHAPVVPATNAQVAGPHPVVPPIGTQASPHCGADTLPPATADPNGYRAPKHNVMYGSALRRGSKESKSPNNSPDNTPEPMDTS